MKAGLTPRQQQALSYVLTAREYENAVQFLDKLALRLRLPLLRLPPPSLSQRARDHEKRHSAVVSRGSTRLFALVYSVAVLYEFIVSLLRRKRLIELLKSMHSVSALRLASFVSVYSAAYQTLLPRLERALPQLAPPLGQPQSLLSLPKTRRRLFLSSKLPPFIAAAAASPAMLLETRGQRRVTIALYALTRALHGLVGAADSKGWTTVAMQEGRWWWGGPIVFGLSNAILLHAFVYDPVAFPAQYGNFILRYSGAYLPARPLQLSATAPWPAPRQIVDAVSEASRWKYPSYASPLLQGASAYKAIGNSDVIRKIMPVLEEKAHPAHERLTCAMLHPDERSCWAVFQRFVSAEFKGAAKFFGALALLSTLTRWKKLLKQPEESVYNAAMSTVTSSAFLSLSLGTAWGSICAFQHYLPNKLLPTKRFYIQGFLAGLWVALVPAQRAVDLGLYSLRIAIQCAWDVGVARGKVKNIRNGELLYCSVAMAVLMSLHDTNPAALKSRLVRAALRRVGGANRLERAKAQESTQETDEEY